MMAMPPAGAASASPVATSTLPEGAPTVAPVLTSTTPLPPVALPGDVCIAMLPDPAPSLYPLSTLT